MKKRTINQTEVEDVMNMIPHWHNPDFRLIPGTITVLIISGLAAIALCKILKSTLNFRLPLQAPLFLFVLLVGIVIKQTVLREYFQHSIHLKGTRDILAVCFPIFALRSSFCIDNKYFFKLLPLMFMAAIGSFLSGVMHGSMMQVIKDQRNRGSKMIGLIFGFLFCNTQPYFISSIFKTMEKYQFLHCMLEGESMINNALSMTVLDVLYRWDTYARYEWYDIASVIFLKFVLTLPLGIMMGKLATLSVIYLKLDMTYLSIIVIGMAIISFKIAELFEISPYVTVIIYNFVLILDKPKFSKIHERDLNLALKIIQSVTDIIIGTYCILQIILGTYESVIQIFHFLVLNYISVLICRFVVFTIMYPVAKKLGFPFNFQIFSLIFAWTSVMSTNIVSMSLIILTIPSTKEDGEEIIIYILFNYFASLIINSSAMGLCIRVLCYQQISSTKVVTMNFIVKHLLEIRDKSVNILKMNRFMADVNWSYVRKMTEISNPYKTEAESISHQKGLLSAPSCPYCNKGIIKLASSTNNLDIIRETRKEIWNYLKTILVIHYELGMVSKESLGIIQNIFDDYSDDDTSVGLINLDRIKLTFRGSKFLDLLYRIYKKFFSFERSKILMPRRHYRRVCYKIVMHKYFTVFMYIVIVSSVIPIIVEHQQDGSLGSSDKQLILICFDCMLLLIYIMELILTILAYSWVYIWKDGFKTYFKSFWHVIDVLALIFLFFEQTLYNVLYVYQSDTYTKVYKILLQCRFLRVFRIFDGQFPRILAIFHGHLEMKLLNSYEIAKALKETIHEFLLVMNRIFPESEFTQTFYENLLSVEEELSLLILKIYIEYPWMITTVKTKQMIANCKNVMIATLVNLKSLGFMDEIEYSSLILSIKAKDDAIKAVKKIKSQTPNKTFLNVMWMNVEDEKIGEFLFTRSSVRVFDAGHVFVNVDDFLEGLFVVIYGVLKLTYSIDNIVKYTKEGIIPVIDGFELLETKETYETYLFPGNSIGELGFLTGRSYDCKIVGVTDVRVYFIHAKYISRSLKLTKHTTEGMYCKMWKYSLLNVAQSILMQSNIYGVHTTREVQLKLENSFIPYLHGYKYLALNDIIEDILLLDGIASDAYTNAIFKAPIHIPRSIVRLLIYHETRYAKVMLIPLPDTENIIPLEIEPEVVEMVTADDPRCIYLGKKKKISANKINVSPLSKTSFSSSFSISTIGSKLITPEDREKDSTTEDIEEENKDSYYQSGRKY